jgi:hypothetical protein
MRPSESMKRADIPRQQFIDPIVRMLGDASEDAA